MEQGYICMRNVTIFLPQLFIALTYKNNLVTRTLPLNNFTSMMDTSNVTNFVSCYFLYNGLDTTVSLPISGASLVPCLITVILVCKLKLHKTLVYRLAFYQVHFSVLWIASIGAYLSGELRIAARINALIVFEALLMGSA